MVQEPSDEQAAIIRPLRLGLSIGHPSGGEGTLGPFIIKANGRLGFLSVAYLLMPRGAKRTDYIHQPGPFQRLLTGETRIATFIDVVSGDSVSPDTRFLPGIAAAELLDDITVEGNRLPDYIAPDRPFLSGVADPDDLKTRDEVALIGRSGSRTGRIEALSIENMGLEDETSFMIPGIFAVRGDHNAFSRPGDAGGLVYRTSDLAAIGLLYGSDRGGSENPKSYVLPLAPALKHLGARFLEGELSQAASQEVLAS